MPVMLDKRVYNLEQIFSKFVLEMSDFKDEMRDFKDEMRDFKDEMRDFKTETRRQWGELSQKMGTMAEDLVAPSVPRILAETVACAGEIDSAVRVKRHHPLTNQQHEFDVIAACGNYLLINETKSWLRVDDITRFVKKTLPEVRNFFPEYQDKKIIGAIASLYVDKTLVRYGEKQGVIVLGFGEDVMDVLNSPDFKPKTW